ncbi:MAG TPA: D-tyrosyl-tRNA(Tyr) deacylase [Prolixibacteraceae bacterium]|nr:D-tyrosyl-tRNA(Tyr) deacylase [Prolixibacteraceae bacterium]
MRAVIQRVSSAQVVVKGKTTAAIAKGLLILLGVSEGDEPADVDWLVKKTSQLRIFDDENGIMNLAITEIQGEVIVVSQFTLHASTKKGNRPSYIRAARPETAIPLYEMFVDSLSKFLEKPVGTGIFGAHMDVSLVNDGPVTIVMDSRDRDF